MGLTKGDYIRRANEINRTRTSVRVKKLERAKRVCLRCDKKFVSESAGNRICSVCKSLIIWS